MTKIEFIHQTIIRMASKLVDSTGSIDGAYRNNLVTEACKLADEAERHGCYFDDENINDSLEKISDTLETIEDDLCGEDIEESNDEPTEEDKKERIERLDFSIEYYKEMLRSAPKDFCETKDGQDWCEHINAKLTRDTEERDKLLKELES